jgi:hypothetical protein
MDLAHDLPAAGLTARVLDLVRQPGLGHRGAAGARRRFHIGSSARQRAPRRTVLIARRPGVVLLGGLGEPGGSAGGESRRSDARVWGLNAVGAGSASSRTLTPAVSNVHACVQREERLAYRP